MLWCLFQIVLPMQGLRSGRNFLTLAEAGLEDPEKFPFKGGKIMVREQVYFPGT